MRDKHLRDPYIEQHTAARIALMMLDAPHDSSHGAIRSRISLAATLRKLMHPATAAVWEQASDLGSCKVWGPASKCSRAATEQCLAVIHQLNTTVTVTLRHVPCFSAEVRKQLASAGATIKGTANDTAGGSNGSKAGLRTAPKFASSSSQLESEGKIHHMHQQQLLVILAATQVQLCLDTGNAKLGAGAYTDADHPVSAVATSLLQARTGCVSSAVVASSWERFGEEYLAGRILPSCSHWGCANLEGGSESAMPTRLCSGCRRARYCCDACQRAAWVGGHREGCPGVR